MTQEEFYTHLDQLYESGDAQEIERFLKFHIDLYQDGETVNLIDVLETGEREALEEIILNQDVAKLYEAYRTCLKETEQLVLRQRYGLFGEKEHTQREIAGDLGISRSYV